MNEHLDQASRLRRARANAGYPDAAAAARAMSANYSTYSAHENGEKGLSKAGARYADFFRVSLAWLLTGRGEMKPTRRGGVPLFGTVGAGSEVVPIAEALNDGPIEWINLPNERSIFALEVSGDSALPRYRHGDYLLIDREPVLPDSMVGEYCVLDLADGRRVAKRLQKIRGVYLLASENKEVAIEESPMIIACYRIIGAMSK